MKSSSYSVESQVDSPVKTSVPDDYGVGSEAHADRPSNPRSSQPVSSPASGFGNDGTVPGLLARLKDVQPRGEGKYQAKCPAHDDDKASLSIGTGEKGKPLVHCHAGCHPEKVLAAVGLSWSSLAGETQKGNPKGRIEKVYDYVDADGNLVHQTVRFYGKKFRQRRPDGNGGWTWNLKDIKTVIYRLPEVLAADQVLVVEGEKDADNLAKIGLTATTCPMGAGKWKPEYGKWLSGKHVIILPDNDEPGRKHACDVATKVFLRAASTKILPLPDLPEKGDVSDWIGCRGTKERLLELAAECEDFKPSGYSIQPGTADEAPKETQAETLIRLASEATLFYTSDDARLAVIPQNGHMEVWLIRSKGFKEWLVSRFYHEQGKPPGNQGLQDALSYFEATARIKGEEHPTYVRVGEHGGNIYLDLCNVSWEAVEISPNGWRIVQDPPVRFVRTKGMSPLPYPVQGGSLEALRPFLNIPNENAFRLFCGFLVHTLCPDGPYPILNLEGEQGTAKSTTARILRSLVDPVKALLKTVPRDERDLMIAATNSRLLAFDNLSGVPLWLSNALCRLTTGGGLSTRQLYSDGEETIFDATRPIILTGIDRIASRHDLIGRSIIINLPVIPKDGRRTEKELWGEFEAARSGILGALCDAGAMALSRISEIDKSGLPRMADFAAWVVAAEPALPWEPGQFIEAYEGNQDDAISLALDNDVVAVAIMQFMEDRREWSGSATDLLEAVNLIVSDTTRKLAAWPKAANGLTKRLRLISAFLRERGIDLDLDGRASNSDRTRIVEIRRVAQNIVQTVQTVRKEPQTLIQQGFNVAECRTIPDDTCSISDDTADDPLTLPPGPKPAVNKVSDDTDDMDGIKSILPNSCRPNNIHENAEVF
jgi:hypothetical protein